VRRWLTVEKRQGRKKRVRRGEAAQKVREKEVSEKRKNITPSRKKEGDRGSHVSGGREG